MGGATRGAAAAMAGVAGILGSEAMIEVETGTNDIPAP
jgi:hypothetical protein